MLWWTTQPKHTKMPPKARFLPTITKRANTITTKRSLLSGLRLGIGKSLLLVVSLLPSSILSDRIFVTCCRTDCNPARSCTLVVQWEAYKILMHFFNISYQEENNLWYVLCWNPQAKAGRTGEQQQKGILQNHVPQIILFPVHSISSPRELELGKIRFWMFHYFASGWGSNSKCSAVLPGH